MRAERTAMQKVLAMFYPERCACCGDVIVCGDLICRQCEQALPYIEPPVCIKCGRGKKQCRCEGHRLHVNRIAAPFYYSGSVMNAVSRIKFSGKVYVSEWMALCVCDTITHEYADIHFDIVVPVPTGMRSLAERGYNQSKLIADGIASRLKLPCMPVLEKIFDNEPQRSLPAYKRSGNVLGVFDLCKPYSMQDVSGKTILLVDDVATTGATLDECAKMLLIYGAKEVYAAAFAVSVPDTLAGK